MLYKQAQIQCLDATKFEEFKVEIEKDVNYEIDGVVIRSDKISFENSALPSYTAAFKFENEWFETVVKGHDWNVTKDGTLTPVVLVAPVVINGRKLKQATGSNLKIMAEQQLFTNNKCMVTCAGSVIPKIKIETGKQPA